jgi:hypothetical protein
MPEEKTGDGERRDPSNSDRILHSQTMRQIFIDAAKYRAGYVNPNVKGK